MENRIQRNIKKSVLVCAMALVQTCCFIYTGLVFAQYPIHGECLGTEVLAVEHVCPSGNYQQKQFDNVTVCPGIEWSKPSVPQCVGMDPPFPLYCTDHFSPYNYYSKSWHKMLDGTTQSGQPYVICYCLSEKHENILVRTCK